MEATSEKQQFTFQAEIKRLLQLLAHSLYQGKEIALRELVSNASDALDKFRFVTLTEPSYKTDEPLEITLDPQKSNNVLVIQDNGIGMTRGELATNLGTIAHSGSLEFLSKMSGDAKKDLSLIGQFGVGFYSAFMIADRVEVRTRSYQDDSGWVWESDGSGTFTIEAATEPLPRGTRVILHLKPETSEFADENRIRDILRKYSNFVPHPLRMGDKLINEVRPIWVEPKSQLTEEQYVGFYHHLSHQTYEKPLWHLHFSADSPIQFHAILYCPSTNRELLGFSRLEHGLHLCAKRVLVQNDCRDLLPEYLRFLTGLVDSADLPLNISRETLQDNSVFRKIRSTLVKKVIDRLDSLSKENAETYATFYQQFGIFIKEGVHSDFENRQRLAKLLRFTTTVSDVSSSLEDYVSRMKESQKEIYYLSGPDLASIRKNPNLEIFRKRGLEVLLLPEPIDEFVVTALERFDGRDLRSIDASDLEIPEGAETEETKAPSGQSTSGFGKVIATFKTALGDLVQDVRESKRLTDSPCCLVTPDGGLSPQMLKVLRMANRDIPAVKRILEVNPASPLIRRLCELAANEQNDSFIGDCGRQLFCNALMLEGTTPQPEEMVSRIEGFIEQAARSKSSIILG